MSVLAGGPSADRIVADRSARNPRALPAVGDFAAAKIAARLRTALDTSGAAAVSSFIVRTARVFRGHPALGYMAAIVSVGLAVALQWGARDFYQGAPFLTIYPAVVVTTFIGGYRAGLLSALLAGLSQWFLFIPEFNSVAVISFALDAVLCVSVIEYTNRSLEKEIEARQHQALLKDELHHRMQNLFAVIQSVVRFSLLGNDVPVSPRVIEARLFERLRAMFDANRYVGDAAGNVALLDLIRSQIRGFDDRIVVRGRPYRLLDQRMTQNVSLIVHELVTNSLKYGALSLCCGRVNIDLKETCAGVTFDWAEVDGPAVPAPPADGSGGGFGSHLLGPFARGFCADVKICYEPSGFRYGLRIPCNRPV